MNTTGRFLLTSLFLLAFSVTGCKKKAEKEEKAPPKTLKKPVKKPVVKKPVKPTKSPKGGGIMVLKGKPADSMAAKRPDAKKWDKPKVKYKSLKAVKKAGKKAIGKLALIKGYVKSVGSPAYFGECKYKGDSIPLLATYPAKLTATLRGLGRYCQCKKPARILVKITGDKNVAKGYSFFQSSAVIGEIVAIYDVQPNPVPEKLPKGVGFIAFNDLLFAGKGGEGKVLDIGVRANGTPSVVDKVKQYELVADECGSNYSENPEIRVKETKETKAFLEKMFKNRKDCFRVRFQITKALDRNHSNTFHAKIIGTGEQFPRPPVTCP